jgi:glycosyltransferase involved in cell wall biosynthesis
MSPALTIVIPTRNGADRLPATLARLRQEIAASGADAEVLVVDDRSTDATKACLDAIGRDWPALRVLDGAGKGPGAARNRAVAVAGAPLVAFADDDDLWSSGSLTARLAAHAAHPEAVLSLCDYAHVSEASPSTLLPTAFAYWPSWRRFRGVPLTRLADARPLIAAENAVGTSTVTVRRDAFRAVQGFDEGLPSASDWDLWLKLARLGPVLVLGRIGATYAMRAGSVTSNRAARLDAMATVLRRHPDLPRWSRRRVAARLAGGRSEAAEASGARPRALAHALHALALCPGSTRLRRCLGLIRRLP